jgi:hypothetical protein
VRPVVERREDPLRDDDNVRVHELANRRLLEGGHVLDDERLEGLLGELLHLLRPLGAEMRGNDDERSLDRNTVVLVGKLGVLLETGSDESESDGSFAVTDCEKGEESVRRSGTKREKGAERTSVGHDSTTNVRLPCRLRLSVPSELRKRRLRNLLLNPRLRVVLLLDHPVERTTLLRTKLDVLEAARVLGLLVVAVVLNGEDRLVVLLSAELDVAVGQETPFDGGTPTLVGGVVGRKLGESAVGQRNSVETDAEFEGLADLTSVNEEGRRAVLEKLLLTVKK